jgi:uncharacterized membrane protein
VASAIHLSLAVVFLTIAIPLKASGHWITVSWLVEGLALLWVATRLAGAKAVDEGSRTGSAHASRSLRWLALVSLLLGFCGICVHLVALSGMAQISLLNDGVGTALVGIAVFAGVAWLALRAGSDSQAGVEAGTSGRTPVWSRTAMDAFILEWSTSPVPDRGFLHRTDRTGGFRGRHRGLGADRSRAFR